MGRRRAVGEPRRAGAAIWACCLMPSHVHLIATPADAEGLRTTFAKAHRRYHIVKGYGYERGATLADAIVDALKLGRVEGCRRSYSCLRRRHSS